MPVANIFPNNIYSSQAFACAYSPFCLFWEMPCFRFGVTLMLNENEIKNEAVVSQEWWRRRSPDLLYTHLKFKHTVETVCIACESAPKDSHCPKTMTLMACGSNLNQKWRLSTSFIIADLFERSNIANIFGNIESCFYTVCSWVFTSLTRKYRVQLWRHTVQKSITLRNCFYRPFSFSSGKFV